MIKQNNISFWVQSLLNKDSASLMANHTPPLLPQSAFDIAIIGGGLTGLWLAYYLIKEDPELNIAIFEREQVGYGASGRNGGWLSREVPISKKALLKKKNVKQADIDNLYHEMQQSVAEVQSICLEEQIDCDLISGGILTIATNPAQEKRVSELETDDWSEILSKEKAQARINSPLITKAFYDHVGSRIHPLKLLLNLKQILLQRGVKIYENHPVISLKPHHLVVNDGNQQQSVTTQKIITCTEAYSSPLLDKQRVIPVNSSIIVTEVISEERWKKIGWENRELLADNAHLFFYAQRTFDNRILIGGRGAPYQFGAKDAGHGELGEDTAQALLKRLHELFPEESFQIEYAWKGSIGITRDWTATVTYNPTSEIGHIYGFVGSGVTTTNLAARTMVDQIYQRDSHLTKLPWNNHLSPSWEPEPIKWLAIQSMYSLLKYADYKEKKHQLADTSWLATLSYTITGYS